MNLIIILVLSVLSYAVGARSVLAGNYKPNVYSRIIWFLLAVNGLAGLIVLQNDTSVIGLSAVQTLGSLLILILSLKFSVFKFGLVEAIASVLLLTSVFVWFFADLPIINVVISLIAHFIAGIPSLVGVIKHPKSEKTAFWGYFALASLVSLVFIDELTFKQVIFPAYFLFYNLVMVTLSRRH